MADKDTKQPTHKAFTVIKREGKEDYWVDIGVAFPHKDGRGFTIRLQAIPRRQDCLPRVCRGEEPTEEPTATVTPLRPAQPDRQGGSRRSRR